MCLDGRSKETSWLSNDQEYKQGNLLAIKTIVSQLQNRCTSTRVGNNHLWRDVDKQQIIEFLDYFKVYQNDAFGISSRMPINFIRKYAQKTDTKWDVAIYSGNGDNEYIGGIHIKKENRKVTLNNDCIEVQNRQVSTGTSESIALDAKIRTTLGSKRRQAREQLKNPLLRLHILETEIDARLAAFGVSFPSRIISDTKNISLTINTVYQQQLLNFLQDEEQSDD